MRLIGVLLFVSAAAPALAADFAGQGVATERDRLRQLVVRRPVVRQAVVRHVPSPCIACSALPFGGLRKPHRSELPFGGLASPCPRPPLRTVVVRKG